MEIRDELANRFGEDLLFADSFDSAIIGVAAGHDSGRVVYDTRKMVAVLLQEENLTEEEAWEYLEFNTFGAYVGKQTPLYVYRRET
tara:strand:- start:169 stop:426 length:258 start_codon:yes stop_codon:yes gene_type:complete